MTTTPDLEDLRLTEWTSCGGCAAKWGGSPLAALLSEMSGTPNVDDLLVGLAPFDDAAVYRLSEDIALVSTTDFFPPLVDDAADFGAIAAANACSNVSAMGGHVVLALNIAAFPEHMPTSAIAAIFAAATATVEQAGGVVAGGHTIRSPEPIFGLAVQGVVHPGHIFTKGGARPGDALVVSKPLGTGIVLTAGTAGEKATAIAGMRRLNRDAALALSAQESFVHAVTDVTGYGLFGHASEMAERSELSFHLDASKLPLYPGALRLAADGVRTGGDERNRQYLGAKVDSDVDAALEAVAFDPQTSGGLLAAVDPQAVARLSAAGFVAVGHVGSGSALVVLRA